MQETKTRTPRDPVPAVQAPEAKPLRPPEADKPGHSAADMPIEQWYFCGEGSVMRRD